ncbi:unnamed protein product [Rotaria sp. Silwood2]|nr:unnamed protein product [Rotaria sp. Silwood2]CAF2646713.1 unnamed protein product [Rotaria sp. Silwood2]CAF2865778.1 unnamed protein product [Rotaria sp. Silwood2]CAF3316681.1 unnamed protein product [Rotaria sp. Silwood2]CAF3951203.1 unnamed protein product [Rotaria sp. Silwood2]
MATNQISSVINCTRRTARNILRLFHETNNVIEREGRGRTLLSNDDVHMLRQLFYRYPTETVANINDRFFQKTIRNYRQRLRFRPIHAR